MDKLVGGGLDRGTNSLILGPSGTGKSTIVLHYVLAAAERGEKSVIYLFGEDKATILRRAEALDLPLSQFLDSGHIHISAINASESSPGHFSHLVRKAIAQREISFLAIDSLNGYGHAMPSETALVSHLHDLLIYLGAQGVVAMLTMNLNGLYRNDLTSVGNMSYVADTILLLRYIEVGHTVHKSIAAVKQRTRDHEKCVRQLRFGPGGVNIGEPFSASAFPAQEQSSKIKKNPALSENGSME